MNPRTEAMYREIYGKNSKNETAVNIILSLSAAFIYSSATFIAHILSYIFGDLFFVYIMLAAAVYGLALISRSKVVWLIKWGMSVLFSFVFFLYFGSAGYLIRALNRLIPGYGEQASEGMFEFLVMLTVVSELCLVTGIVSLFLKIGKNATFRKIQLIITVSFAVITAACIVIPEFWFPSYEFISSNDLTA